MDEHNNSGYDNKGTFGNGIESWSENKQQSNVYQTNGEQRDPFEKQINSMNQPYNNDMNGGYSSGNVNNYRYYSDRWNVQENEQTGNGFAVASFAIAILNLLFFKSLLSIITVPICIILAIICFKKHGRGKGFAIAGMVISFISVLICAFFILFFVRIFPDIKYFMENDSQIISEFEENGTIPERYKKYLDPKFSKYWEAVGFNSFNELFETFVEGYSGTSVETNPSSPYVYYEEETDDNEYDDDYTEDDDEIIEL